MKHIKCSLLLCGLTMVLISGTQVANATADGKDTAVQAEARAGSENDLVFQDRFEPIFQDCIDCPTMIRFSDGFFVQGSPTSEPLSSSDERPERPRSLGPFAISLTEVTFADWDACVVDGGCSHNPSDSGWGRGDRPVINVSWNDAQEYVDWLTRKTLRPYRLPSESEWEFATRAGTTGRFNTGDCITSDQANFLGSAPALGCDRGFARSQTLPVKSFSSNDFGLYDTHGNVWEWVQDCWNSDYNGAPTNGSAWTIGDCSRAVLRGGGWNVDGNSIRSANRNDLFRDIRSNSLGFRVAMAIPRVFQDCTECPRMVMISGGTFTQGAPETEQQSDSEERPLREVTFSNPFAIGQTEVTFEEWDACVADGGCSHNPSDSGWGRGDRPVINVNWNDAQEYVDWLTNKTGQLYRLPSESEWEFAARGGTEGRFNTGDCISTDQANFNGSRPAVNCREGLERRRTLPVRSFPPNIFGLYETHGNVAEWVQDCWNDTYIGAPTNGSAWTDGDCSRAVWRGGHWGSPGLAVRSARRDYASRTTRFTAYGFRVAKSLGP